MKKSTKAIPNSVLNIFAAILAAGLAFAIFGCKVNLDESYAITVSDTEHGSVKASSSSTTAGSTVTLTVSPESGYKLDTLTVTDASGNEVTTKDVKTGEKYTFKMPKSEVSVFATFSVPIYNIRLSNMENGYVIPSVYFAEEGSTITLSVTPSYSRLGTLTVTDTSGKNVAITAVTEGSEYIFTMPASDVTVQATFIANMYNITVSDTEHGSVKASASSATAGSTVTLTVSPESGYKLDTLTVTDESGLQLPVGFPDVWIEGLESDFTFTINPSNVTVQATFSVIISDITVSDTEHGSVTASASRITAGSTITLTVTPENGYRLLTLNVRDGSGNEVTTTEVKAGEKYTFKMPSSAVAVWSTFTEIIYDITVSGTEHGYVSPSANWAAEGSEITLSASPHSGYRLDTLTVTDGNGKNVTTKIVTEGEKYTFTMPASDVTVHATYVAAIYNITVSSAEHGSVTASASSAAYGSAVTLTVTSENGYRLGTLTVTDTLRNVWYPTAVKEGSEYTFTMPASNVTVKAEFSDIYYNITSSNTDYGYVTASTSWAAEGREITLTVSPYSGYRLDTLTVTDTSGKKVTTKILKEGEKYTFTMPASDVTVSATYVAAVYNITVFGTEHGSVKVASSAAYGSTVTLTVTPESGYRLNSLTVTDANRYEVTTTAVTEGEKYTFTMPASDVTVQAEFSDICYNITVSDSEHGYVNSSNYTAVEGNEITLTVTPDNGYRLNTLTVTDSSGKNVATRAVTEGENYTFTMPSSDVTVQATFSVIIYKSNITISSAEHGSVTASASSAAEGDKITLTVTPESGYSFGSLSVRVIVTDEISLPVTTTEVKAGSEYTFVMPSNDVTVQATFSVIIHDDIYYNITVSDAENGYVNSSTYTATEGEKITLTVSPYSDYRLDTLTVTDASGKNVSATAVTEGEKYTFTMPASDVTVQASFSVIKYSITVSDTEHGSVTASENSAVSLSEITLTVTPENSYRLDTLTVTDASGNELYPIAVTEGEKYTFTIYSSDVTVQATFVPILYKITNSGSLALGSTTASTYSAAKGSTVTLTVYPLSGYRLNTLTVTDASGKNVSTAVVTEGEKYTFTMPASDVTFSATYVTAIYNITISDSEHGSVKAASSAAYRSTVTLAVTPESGYILESLTVKYANGKESSISTDTKDSECTFTMPDSDVTILATFTVRPYNISAFNGIFGKVEASPNPAVAGSTVTLTVTPKSGFRLDMLTVTDANGENVETTRLQSVSNIYRSEYTFTMPDSDVTVSATFSAIKYSITVSDTEHGSVTASPSSAEVGSTITLTLTPDSLYTVDELKVVGGKIETTRVSAMGGKYTYTFTMPATNVTVNATFKPNLY